MKTKSITNIFALALILLTVLGCGRYEDGPCISFRSVKSRLEGQYIVTFFEKNGQDVLPEWKENFDWKISFSNDRESDEYNFYANGKYKIDTSFYYLNQHGRYELPLGKEQISFNLEIPYSSVSVITPEYGFYPFIQNETIVVDISRLTKDDLWISHRSGNDFYEIHLKKIKY